MDTLYSFLRSPLLSLSGPLVISLVAIIFWFRAGSTHALLERVWRLIAGKADISDKILSEFVQDTRELERFRFMYGLKVETKDELHKLISWLKINSIGIGIAQRAKNWIDIKSDVVITKPNKSYFAVRLIIVILCAIVAAFLATAGSSSSALLQMKESKIWFLTDGKIVNQYFGGWSFDKDNCISSKESIAKTSQFSEEEISMLCKALNNGDLKSFVSKTVEQQRLLSLFFGGADLIWIFIVIIQINSADAARNIFRSVSVPAKVNDSEAGRALETEKPKSTKRRVSNNVINSENLSGESTG